MAQDLLGSILDSMDKPPSRSDKERKQAKELKAKLEKKEEELRKWQNKFKQSIEKKAGELIDDPKLKRLKLPPANKLSRQIIHEVAEAAGLISHSFGIDEDSRHVILFKKEYPPSENELKALRNGEEYDPEKDKAKEEESASCDERLHPQATAEDKYGTSFNYQEKYRKLLGGLDCAEKSAVKMQPNKSFGYVPSANKRDLRSIEQTLNDMRSRKKPKLDSELSSNKADTSLAGPE